MPPTIAPAAPADLPAVLDLIDRSKLPRAGLEQYLATTLVAREGNRIVGTAAQFFPKFGFPPITRAEVDRAALNSLEFTDACPHSAVVMRAELTP